MSTNFKGSNFRYGIEIDKNNENNLTDERLIKGSRRTMTVNFAAATVAQGFWIAPKACKIISVKERHVTAAGQAGTLQIEKVPSGTSIGSGTVLLASAIDLAGTADTIQSVLALTTAAGTLASGDMLATKLASGAATSLVGATATILIEWL